MFHPERLTGARKRAWLRNNTYVSTIDIKSLPKTVRDKVKHPERLKGYIRVAGIDKVSHYILVIGAKLAFIGHYKIDAEEAMASISGHKPGCRCYEIRGFYKTWTEIDRPDKSKYYAHTYRQMPERLMDIREKCRPPARPWRCVSDKKSRYRHLDRRYFEREYDFEPQHPAPYEPKWHSRCNYIENSNFYDKLCEELTTKIADETRRISGVNIELKRNLSYSPYVDKKTTDGKTTYVIALNYDPLTWYCRVRTANVKVPEGMVLLSIHTFGTFTFCRGFSVSKAIDFCEGVRRNEIEYEYWFTDGQSWNIDDRLKSHIDAYCEADSIENKLKQMSYKNG